MVAAMMHKTGEKLWNTADIRNACLLLCPTVSCTSLGWSSQFSSTCMVKGEQMVSPLAD